MLTLAVMASLSFSGCGGGGSSTPPPPTTFTIGGTVSGLSGKGLELQDNGGDYLPMNANGNFTFATQIASGGTYSVTVSTQPSNPLQLCVVANGSGTANANITSVQVTCTTEVGYNIGGTVSGLSSMGLVLQDNGGGKLQIIASGNFTFGTQIASGGTYDVTVYEQPYTQLCAVANGSGTANANVTDVQVTCASPQEQVLYGFGNSTDGRSPAADLVFDGSGNLYGTTSQGGTFGYGTVFKLTPSNGQWTETVLHSFCQPGGCQDGATPLSGLVFDGAGNLYGTTFQGGGIVFEMTPNPDGTWTETVLHTFGNGTDGVGPLGRLVLDSAGNLYGTTSSGGTSPSGNCFGGCGTVFKLSPGSNGQWTESVLYNFCSQAGCADGNAPTGGVIFDAAGNLYGTTVDGGTPDQHLNGTVFELTPGGNGQWVETVLYMFQNATTDGNNPRGDLVQDKSGNLYGTTSWGYSVPGGGFGNGIVFELTRGPQGQWTEKIVHPFCSDVINCSDGTGPLGGLVFDKAGNLYGTTSSGGASNCVVFTGCGVVFELASGSWFDTVLYSFPGGAPGLAPSSGVIFDAAGNLYGVASGGGTYGYGVVFEVTP